MIRKEAFLNDTCLTELRRIIEGSEILREDDQVLCIGLLIQRFVNTRCFLPHTVLSFGQSPTILVGRFVVSASALACDYFMWLTALPYVGA
jgi:hypothetical protein